MVKQKEKKYIYIYIYLNLNFVFPMFSHWQIKKELISELEWKKKWQVSKMNIKKPSAKSK